MYDYDKRLVQIAQLVGRSIRNNLTKEDVADPAVSHKQLILAARLGVMLAVEDLVDQDPVKGKELFGMASSTYHDNVNALRNRVIGPISGQTIRKSSACKPKKPVRTPTAKAPAKKTKPKTKPAVPAEIVTELTPETLQKIVDSGEMALIFVSSKYCGTCKGVRKNFLQTAEETHKKKGRVNFYEFKTDEQQELAEVFKVRSVPCIIAIKKGVVLYNDAKALYVNQFLNIICSMANIPVEAVAGSIDAAEATASDVKSLKVARKIYLDSHHRVWP